MCSKQLHKRLGLFMSLVCGVALCIAYQQIYHDLFSSLCWYANHMALLHTNRRNKEVVNSAEVSADSPDKLVQKKYYIQDGWCMGQPILEIKYGQIKMWSEPGDEIVIPTHLLFKIVVEYATNLLNEQKSCISEIQQ